MDSGFREGTCDFIPGSLLPEKRWAEEEWQKAHGCPKLWRHSIPEGCYWRRASPWQTRCSGSSFPSLYWLNFPSWLFLRSHWPRMAGMSILNQSLSKGLRQPGLTQTNHDWLCGLWRRVTFPEYRTQQRVVTLEPNWGSVSQLEVSVCVCVCVCVCRIRGNWLVVPGKSHNDPEMQEPWISQIRSIGKKIQVPQKKNNK